MNCTHDLEPVNTICFVIMINVSQEYKGTLSSNGAHMCKEPYDRTDEMTLCDRIPQFTVFGLVISVLFGLFRLHPFRFDWHSLRCCCVLHIHSNFCYKCVYHVYKHKHSTYRSTLRWKIHRNSWRIRKRRRTNERTKWKKKQYTHNQHK